ncbi:MAG: insulinase family protein [Opitutae bacterium]|nr:insulinase family protein [Opitutae bacterium]
MLLLRALVFLLVLSVARAALPFAHEASDLKPDPAVRFGTLPNGIRYVVRANAEPKGRAALRLMVLAGSFMETDAQRGLAHFLEHMSFNGSAHYAPGTLIEFFQRMGMNFGGDTNAYTSFDHTVYMIDLPDTKSATLAEGLRVFSDYAGGLLLDAKEIERERGVILAEKRTRDSVQYRTMIAEMEFVLAGTRVPARLPIGVEDVISRAPRAEFLDYYDTWYRPDRIAVVAVGDFEVVAMEQAIVEALQPIAARAPARPVPALGKPADAQGLQVRFHPEAEAPSTIVTLSTITPCVDEPDTAANRLKYLPRTLALAMVNRRLAILAKTEGAPFTSAAMVIDDQYDLYREASLNVSCQPAQWAAALGVAEQELRRALEHGFQPGELKEAVANTRNALDQAAKTASTRRSHELAGELVQSLVERTVFTTPADELALFQPALDSASTDACAAALRAAWSAPHRYLFVTGNPKIEGDAPAVIAAAYEKSRAVKVAAPAAVAEDAFAYTNFGPAGKIAHRTEVADLGVTLVEFANGVRLNFKKTDFEANCIRINVRVGAGMLTEPRTQPGLGVFASNTFTAGGLGRHSLDDLQRLLAGKTVGTNFRVGTDALLFQAATNREDLLLQCQLIAAYLTDPGYRPEALRQILKGLEHFYNSLEHTPDGPLKTAVPRLLACDDPRFGLPDRATIMGRTLEEVRQWLAPQLASGPIEIALAGELDPDAVIAAVAGTLGALPARTAKPAYTAERQVAFPAAGLTREFRVDTKIPKGVVALYWPTTDNRDVQRTRRLNVLGEILQDRLRLKVRQELGEAYSPGAGSLPSDTFTDYGFMLAQVTVDPAQAQRVTDVILAIAADLHEHGVTADELARAKLPILTALREGARTNHYWLAAVLSRAQEKPAVLDWCRSRYADYEAVTTEEIAALAKTYLAPARVCQMLVRPAAEAKP